MALVHAVTVAVTSPSSSSSSSSVAVTATSINTSNRYNLIIIMGRSKRSPSPKFRHFLTDFLPIGFSTNSSENYIKCQAESAVFKVMEGAYLLRHLRQGLETAVPVLLVDGYNVCGYWAKLKKHFMNGRLDIARQKLIDDLVTFSLLREVKVVVVFDAMMSGLPTHKETFDGVDIVFSGESCADAWIEKEVVALREDGCPRVWVATSDHVQQHAAHGAGLTPKHSSNINFSSSISHTFTEGPKGAFVWSCKALVSEIKASKKEVEMMLQEHRSTSFQGRLLKHNLDSDVVDALKDLRKKLSETKLK
ncbi:yacP-like NYN domain protein [Parasponia andersonii]|uniref:YacP-like NYN domain protein n=1 Tax=Parasponia andersonii TaxID=3476 RepID=A0A2P5BY18_PARAD|nr:yacP-like NYN domain protein [Parasponia andersonii]